MSSSASANTHPSAGIKQSLFTVHNEDCPELWTGWRKGRAGHNPESGSIPCVDSLGLIGTHYQSPNTSLGTVVALGNSLSIRGKVSKSTFVHISGVSLQKFHG